MQVEFDRIVARLGAAARGDFLAQCGVVLEGDGPSSRPAVSDSNQSLQVPGLYVIGAACGSPLIKACLDEGYRVVETILGNTISPADEDIIKSGLSAIGLSLTPMEVLEPLCCDQSPFAGLSPLRLHRLLVEGKLQRFSPNDKIFVRGDYSTSLYVVLAGEVEVCTGPDQSADKFRARPGQIFGEIEVISGRRRRAFATAISQSLLLELRRETILRLARQAPDIGVSLERTAVIQQIRADFAPKLTEELLSHLARSAEIRQFRAQELLLDEKASDQPVYIIRKGAVTISRQIDGKAAIVDYLQDGDWIGGGVIVDPLSIPLRAEAAIEVEAIKIDSGAVRHVLQSVPTLGRQLRNSLDARRSRWRRSPYRPEIGSAIEFMLEQNVPAANDILVINNSLCINCDNCETACAETHGGISGLNREAGARFAELHIPAACRHCDDAPCQELCPADALQRGPFGEIFVDSANCLGCGDCERACPYDAIAMASTRPEKPGLLRWLLFGRRPGPGENTSPEGLDARSGRKLPAKCDLCRELPAGPACVRSCPTGAVFRAKPKELLTSLTQSP